MSRGCTALPRCLADTDPEFPPIVLTFAASDPSGGAGMQADMLTLASMGCHPLSVVTAITVQDTLGVEGVQAIDAEWVADQARCLLEDMPVDAFKIGVLGSVENIAAIAEIVSDYPDVPLVLDPVLASGRGDELATDEMTHALRELLLPQTTILTPNSIEARRLAEVDDDDEPSLATCAAALIEMGAEYVLVTGTHEATPQVVNTLYGKSGVVRTRHVAAPAGQLPRLRLHARLGDRRDARQRTRAARGRARSAGLHVACAARRRTGPAWASICPIACSGRARTPDRARRRCGRRGRAPADAGRAAAMTTDACKRAARARRALAGLYAVTPDLADTGDLVARVAAALAGGASAIQYRNKTADARRCGASRRWRSRESCAARGALFIVNDDPALAVGRRRRRRARRARTTAASRGRARCVGRDRIDRRVLLQRFGARAGRASPPAPTTSRSAASSRRAIKPGARRADRRPARRSARRSRVPVVAIGGITVGERADR